MPWSESHLRKLEEYLGREFPTFRACYEGSEHCLVELSEAVKNSVPSQASFVVFGSLGRKEFLPGSDLDWCLLIDGRADPEHRQALQEVRELLERDARFRAPNAIGPFGDLVFGHELIHWIGGSGDSNSNLTRRLLLLLESAEAGPVDELSARSSVLHGVLRRYFEDERRFKESRFFPLFFLNDVVRYWRTIAVDYAAKNADRGGKGWALRNLKLRFSRKLLFVAGLLLTYETALFSDEKSEAEPSSENERLAESTATTFARAERCFEAAQYTPLELLARACVRLKLPQPAVATLFSAYEGFLELLRDSRAVLDELSFEEAYRDPLFGHARTLGKEFQRSLDELFLAPSKELGKLTLQYAIF
jgi:hypothetical protein